MNWLIRSGATVLALAFLLAPLALAAESAARYEHRAVHDPEGTGKFYLGREIAQVMGPEGMAWLERPEREAEEKPSRVVEALQLKAGDRVADLGAGSGYFTFRIAKVVQDQGRVFAIDIEPKMLGAIRARAEKEHVRNVVTLLATERDPMLSPNCADWVLMVDVYHELAYPYEVMRKVRDALVPGGRVALVEYRQEDPAVSIKDVHKMAEAQMRREMAAAGFTWVETVRSLPQQHLAIFRK